MIFDGFGIAKDPSVSAIDQAKTPFIDSLYHDYPHARLQASGLAVGLPEGQMGNSEVGHMNLGAGRVVYQDIVRINKAIEDGSFFTNPELVNAFETAENTGSKIHLMGLLSDGGIHSHIDHLKALTTMAAERNFNDVFVHAFTDGRDTDPHSGKGFVEEIKCHLKQTTGRLASITGRYYAMDRDKRWERVKLAYDALTGGIGKQFDDPVAAVVDAYDNGETDEFIKPRVMVDGGKPVAVIEPGDVVIHFNFRSDRARELTFVLTQQDMPQAGMTTLPLHYVTMTNYDEAYEGLHILYDKPNLKNTLGEVIARNGLHQIRIAETEKYAHVTYFFNGGREEPFENEKRILVPSPKVATYDLKPEMSAFEVRDRIVDELKDGWADFVVLNFANPDMVGHTGVWEAAVKAIETVDQCAEAVINTGLDNGYATLLLADHGNSDCMKNPDGSPNTAHTTQPVPWFFIDSNYHPSLKDGKLADVAPTILTYLGIPIPDEMNGTVLFE